MKHTILVHYDVFEVHIVIYNIQGVEGPLEDVRLSGNTHEIFFWMFGQIHTRGLLEVI